MTFRLSIQHANFHLCVNTTLGAWNMACLCFFFFLVSMPHAFLSNKPWPHALSFFFFSFFFCYYYYFFLSLLVKSIWMKKGFILSFGLLSGDSDLSTLCLTLWLFYVRSSRDLYEFLLLQVAAIKCASLWSSFTTRRGLLMIDLSPSCAMRTKP